MKTLTGELKGFYRLRIGNCRIIFAFLAKEKIIAVVNIFPQRKCLLTQKIGEVHFFRKKSSAILIAILRG